MVWRLFWRLKYVCSTSFSDRLDRNVASYFYLELVNGKDVLYCVSGTFDLYCTYSYGMESSNPDFYSISPPPSPSLGIYCLISVL